MRMHIIGVDISLVPKPLPKAGRGPCTHRLRMHEMCHFSLRKCFVNHVGCMPKIILTKNTDQQTHSQAFYSFCSLQLARAKAESRHRYYSVPRYKTSDLIYVPSETPGTQPSLRKSLYHNSTQRFVNKGSRSYRMLYLLVEKDVSLPSYTRNSYHTLYTWRTATRGSSFSTKTASLAISGYPVHDQYTQLIYVILQIPQNLEILRACADSVYQALSLLFGRGWVRSQCRYKHAVLSACVARLNMRIKEQQNVQCVTQNVQCTHEFTSP